MRYAEIEKNLVPSAIRESVKYASRPGMISFAGGSPDPVAFPAKELIDVTAKILTEKGSTALTYSASEGITELRELILEHMSQEGIPGLELDNILITNGSQQGLDFCGKLFVNPGDIVICEDPSYLGALNAFAVYGARFVGVPTDDEGMVMEALEKTLQQYPDAKFIYTVPSFQNPTGKTIGQARRKEMLRLAEKYQVPIVEDNPYGNLYFEGKPELPIKHYDTKDMVIYLGTYSKTFCPGLRIGWIAADPELIRKFTIMKQSTDLHTSTLAQMQLYEYIRSIDWQAHNEELRALYRAKKDAMVSAMAQYFPKCIRYTNPKGGLFTWADLPEDVAAEDVLLAAVEKKVCFVPGAPFYIGDGQHNHIRLSFGTSSAAEIHEGIKRLGETLEGFCK